MESIVEESKSVVPSNANDSNVIKLELGKLELVDSQQVARFNELMEERKLEMEARKQYTEYSESMSGGTGTVDSDSKFLTIE